MTSSQSERKSTKKGSTWKCQVRHASSYWELMDRYGKCLPNVTKCFLLAFSKSMAIQEKGVMCPDSRLISPYWPHWYWGESYLRRMLCTHERMWPTVDQVTIHCRRSRRQFWHWETTQGHPPRTWGSGCCRQSGCWRWSCWQDSGCSQEELPHHPSFFCSFWPHWPHQAGTGSFKGRFHRQWFLWLS